MKVRAGLMVVALLAIVCQAQAVPTVTLDAANVGIGNINVIVSGTNITIAENWTQIGNGLLRITGLDAGVDYTVTKNIQNNTGVNWVRIANELLDPAGQSEDALDPHPYEAFVPAGFSTSNNSDGLNFAQGSSILRTSTAFSSLTIDELSDVRDFLDFFNGTVLGTGGTDSVSFGLRDNNPTNNEAFLLSQRPNVTSVSAAVPEPGTLALLGTGLMGLLGYGWRRRSQ